MSKRKAEPTREEFEAWADNPVTRWIMGICNGMAKENEAEWHRMSWVGGNADPNALIELRTRADAYRSLADTDYDNWRDPE